MATTTVDKRFRKAFIVERRFFERFAEVVASHGANLHADITLSDSSKIEKLTVPELLDFANMPHRAIIKIELAGEYRDPLRVSLTLINDREDTPISYRVVGNDKDATYVSGEIEKLLANTFTWYSYFAAMPFTHQGVWFGVLQAIWLLGINAAVFLKNQIPAVPAAIALILSWGGYGTIVRRLFPVGIFMIGDGIGRAQALQRRRAKFFGFLFVTLILGIVVNISASAIYEKYWK